VVNNLTSVPVVLLLKIWYTYFTNMQRLTKSKKLKRIRKHGFLARMKSNDGRKVIKRRRDQNRRELAITL
jgi:ribosomal protein L34